MEGKKNYFLGMTLDYSIKGKLKVDMKQCIKDTLETYPENLSEKVDCPWNTRLFNRNDESQSLNKNKSETFYTFVMKCMFFANRVKPDIIVGISFLTTRVLRSNEEDLKKTSHINKLPEEYNKCRFMFGSK